MRFFVILLIFFSSSILKANTPTIYFERYDNVIVRYEVNEYTEDIYISKIIGEYAAKMCSELGNKDFVFLDFFYVNSPNYKINETYIGVEKNDFHQSYYKSGNKTTWSEEINIINSKEKLVIRQVGSKFDIKETLTLLHYGLSNYRTISRKSKYLSLPNSYLNPQNSNVKVKSLSKNKIAEILKSDNTFIRTLLNHKVYRKEYEDRKRSEHFFSYYAQNNNFTIFGAIHDTIIDIKTVDQIYRLVDPTKNFNTDEIFIFTKENEFINIEDYGYDFDFNDNIHYSYRISNTITIEDEKLFKYGSYSCEIKNLIKDIYIITYPTERFMMDIDMYYIFFKNKERVIYDFDKQLLSK